MRATIKSYDSSDIEDLLSYQPEDASVFGFSLTFSIGIVGKEGADNFEILVATPEYLRDYYAERTPIFIRHCMIVEDYHFPRILGLMTNYVNSLEEDSWEKLAEKLSRVARWEFEDYLA